MPQKDKYANFAELTKGEIEGQDYARYIRNTGSEIVVIAPHGGGIERGTSEIAKALAGDVFSVYCFEGLKRTGNKSLHITSTRFDDPLCLEMVKSASAVVAIHGCDGDEDAVYVGGRKAAFKQRLIRSLQSGGFTASEANDDHPGMHPRNLCNLCAEGGLQLEITQGLRRRMFKGLSRAERKFTTQEFDEFVEVLREGIEDK